MIWLIWKTPCWKMQLSGFFLADGFFSGPKSFWWPSEKNPLNYDFWHGDFWNLFLDAASVLKNAVGWIFFGRRIFFSPKNFWRPSEKNPPNCDFWHGVRFQMLVLKETCAPSIFRLTTSTNTKSTDKAVNISKLRTNASKPWPHAAFSNAWNRLLSASHRTWSNSPFGKTR